MKKIIILLLIGIVLMVGCAEKDETVLSNKIEQKVITTGEIVNLNEVDGEYIVTIGENDEENKCIWINDDKVSEEEFNKLSVGDNYTIKD